jgi:hypothetical protein
MIRQFDYGGARYFRMARGIFGRAISCTGIYYVDGLLVHADRLTAKLARGLWLHLQLSDAGPKD